jgi:hypothetical protein
MRTEQKIFNDLIETIVNNSENNEAKITNVELWAKSWKEEMKQTLTLTDVSERELPHWARPLIAIVTMSLSTLFVIYRVFYVC